MTIAFSHTFADELDGFYQKCSPEKCTSPRLLQLNTSLALELGLDQRVLQDEFSASVFSGNELPDTTNPIAQVYAGHQFGMFTPQLGDGRALLLGEVVDEKGIRRDIQLKGSGRTPFSRGGDGKAALGPVLREYLVSEAMHRFGIATTRALAAVGTEDWVARDELKPRAVLTRVSASHIRVGSFEFFAARGEWGQVKRLADYAIDRHFPHIKDSKDVYLSFFRSVMRKQAKLIADWMSVGFVHGVMNTDNMTISGETIDYGPCAFMDRYVPATVFSSIDSHGRYAYENQPKIGQWNLAQLAKALIPLYEEDQETVIQRFVDELDTFNDGYEACWLENMRAKLGLINKEEGDLNLINQLLTLMHQGDADFTLTFRYLSNVRLDSENKFAAQFNDPNSASEWLSHWLQRLDREGLPPEQCALNMDAVNPMYIPRNYKIEEALDAAVNRNDLAPFRAMLDVVSDPYSTRAEYAAFAESPLPTTVPYVTFCGT
jgi:uncharacterized protein YdiU (UPF0061 family)